MLGLGWWCAGAFRRYGYITNTKIKLVVVTEGDIEPSDNAVKQFLHQFHKLYIDTVCNPFHTLGAPLTSQRCVPPWRLQRHLAGARDALAVLFLAARSADDRATLALAAATSANQPPHTRLPLCCRFATSLEQLLRGTLG